MKRAALIIALAFTATAAVPSVAKPQKEQKPVNFCPGEVDSKTCVSCLDKECHIGSALGDGRTGVFTVDFPADVMPGKHISVEFGELNGLATIEGDADGYAAITFTVSSGPQGQQVHACHVDVYRLPQYIAPPDAPAALDQLAPKGGTTIEQRATWHLGPYTALDRIAKDNKDGSFDITRSAIFQNVFVSKSCTFGARPAFDAQRWNDIKITIPPLRVTI